MMVFSVDRSVSHTVGPSLVPLVNRSVGLSVGRWFVNRSVILSVGRSVVWSVGHFVDWSVG